MSYPSEIEEFWRQRGKLLITSIILFIYYICEGRFVSDQSMYPFGMKLGKPHLLLIIISFSHLYLLQRYWLYSGTAIKEAIIEYFYFIRECPTYKKLSESLMKSVSFAHNPPKPILRKIGLWRYGLDYNEFYGVGETGKSLDIVPINFLLAQKIRMYACINFIKQSKYLGNFIFPYMFGYFVVGLIIFDIDTIGLFVSRIVWWCIGIVY